MNNKKKVIAFIVTAMGRGGAERVISILANHYASINWEVHIVMLWHNLVEYELNDRIVVHKPREDGGNPYLKLPVNVLWLRRKIKQIQPTAVVSFISENNIISYFATRGFGLRFIPSERVDPSQMHRNRLFSCVLNHVYAKSTITVLQTERAKRYFPKKVQRNSVIIYNPVSVQIEALPERKKVVITAGRLSKAKNHKMLIAAFEKFHQKFQDYQLVIYGEGTLRESTQAQINELKLNNSVLLPGNVKNIHELMANAEIFVLSSDYEGMSNALMEAMAIGLPCISTNCAGADELITDYTNGLLVDVGDEEGMVAALTYMVEHRVEAEQMRRTARTDSKKFATENVITQWRLAIEEISK